jgi:hypothetical protein
MQVTFVNKFRYLTEKRKSPSIYDRGGFSVWSDVHIPPPFPRRNCCTQRSGLPEK